MDTKRRRYAFGGLVLCAGLVVLLACGAGPPGPTPFPTLRPTPTPVALPAFLSHVFPWPGSTITGFGGFQHNWIRLNWSEIAAPGETLVPQNLRQRTWLLVDGQSLEFELVEIDLRPGVVAELRTSFSTGPGEHRATIRVRRTSGEMLEFSWVFTVDENAYIIPGLPEGVQFVRPLPDSTITRQEYRGGNSIPAQYVPGFAFLDGGVCYGILSSRVVERGEIMPDVDKKARFVVLDGVPPGPEAHIDGGHDMSLTEIQDQTGQVITSYGGEQYYTCWYADLAPGRHEVTVRLERASGQVTEFTWWFVITE
jgi:hypothetical protein